jgi:hypothetical protein
MPWCSSHRQVSIAVLPAPTTTYRSRASYLGRSFGGMQSTPGATSYEGRRMDGTVIPTNVVLTRRRAATRMSSPPSVRIRPSPEYSLIGK